MGIDEKRRILRNMAAAGDLAAAQEQSAESPPVVSAAPTAAPAWEGQAQRVLVRVGAVAAYLPIVLALAMLAWFCTKQYRLGARVVVDVVSGRAHVVDYIVDTFWFGLIAIMLVAGATVLILVLLRDTLSPRARWWAFGINAGVLALILVAPFAMIGTYEWGRANYYAALDRARLADECHRLSLAEPPATAPAPGPVYGYPTAPGRKVSMFDAEYATLPVYIRTVVRPKAVLITEESVDLVIDESSYSDVEGLLVPLRSSFKPDDRVYTTSAFSESPKIYRYESPYGR